MSSSSTASEEDLMQRRDAPEDQNPSASITGSGEILPVEGELSEQSHVRVPVTISAEDRHVLRDKMKDMFATFITDIDNHVLDVAKSQCELDSQLDKLIETLDSIKIDEKLTRDISENAKRISSLKSRLTVIHTILSDSSARCSRTLAACGPALQSKSPAGSGTDHSLATRHSDTGQQQQPQPQRQTPQPEAIANLETTTADSSEND